MLDFDVQRCTRRCSVSQRELRAGELCYSAIVSRGAQVVRLDFAPESWKGPPENSLGWWKARVPENSNQKVAWAPNDVMLDYFEFLADKPEKADVRYVLALLLVRRRVIRLENARTDDQGNETLVVFCPRNEEESEVAAILPDDERVAEIQAELSTLLFGDASTLMPPRPADEEPAVPPDETIADEAPALTFVASDDDASDDDEADDDEADDDESDDSESDDSETDDSETDDSETDDSETDDSETDDDPGSRSNDRETRT
ncbi:MAG: hypothetical protein U0939_03090 [Pirellulales bacterium]